MMNLIPYYVVKILKLDEMRVYEKLQFVSSHLLPDYKRTLSKHRITHLNIRFKTIKTDPKILKPKPFTVLNVLEMLFYSTKNWYLHFHKIFLKMK